jgi:hypothetical protein
LATGATQLEQQRLQSHVLAHTSRSQLLVITGTALCPLRLHNLQKVACGIQFCAFVLGRGDVDVERRGREGVARQQLHGDYCCEAQPL